MPDIIYGALIGVGGAVIGALVNGILANRNAITVIRITEFNKVASIFVTV